MRFFARAALAAFLSILAGQAFAADNLRASGRSLDTTTTSKPAVFDLLANESVMGVNVAGLTAAGATLTIEGSSDAKAASDSGKAWFSVVGVPFSCPAPATFTTLTTDQSFKVDVSGLTNLRFRVSSTGTGNATIGLNAIPGASMEVCGGAPFSTGSGATDSGTQRVVLATGGATQSTVAPGTAPSNASVVGGVYTATAPSPSDGQTMAVRLDASGNLRTSQPLGAPTWWPATYLSIASNSVTTISARATRSAVTIYNPGTTDLCMTTSSSATSCSGSYTRVRPGFAKTLNTTAAIYLISASGTGSAEVDETGF